MTKSKEPPTDPMEPVLPPGAAPPEPMPPPSSQPPTPEGIPPPPGTEPMTPGSAPTPGPLPESAPKDDTGDPPVAEMAQPTIRVLPPTDAQYAWFAANPGYEAISASLGRYINRGTLSGDGTFTPEGPGTPVINSADGSFGVGQPV